MKRLPLCHTPTPIWRHPALDELLGFELWVKRDDMIAGASAGNKLRKLEYLLADAQSQGATTIITCGGAQSNHARASALAAREVGLRPVLLLRTSHPAEPPPAVGNVFLDRLAGAELRFITPEQYRDRATLMADVAAELSARGERPYLIPEGGSNGLGALGYFNAVAELCKQQESGELPEGLALVAVACGSGGTAAGVALGLGRFPGVAERAVAFAVCDDRPYFEALTAGIVDEARELDPSLPKPGPLDVDDRFKGPAYGLASPEQLDFIVRVARASGLVLEPSYTGKALFGLSRLSPKPPRALFIHTGGLPGLLAEPAVMAAAAALDAAGS
jgi:D-cysteine desulfhydrase